MPQDPFAQYAVVPQNAQNDPFAAYVTAKPAASVRKSDTDDEGLQSLLPTVGGVVGGMVGGVPGAAMGGAAGQGYRTLINSATEIPDAVKDIVGSGHLGAAAKGFAEGSGLGAADAAVQGAIQGAVTGAGSLLMKAPGALVGAAEMLGVPGAPLVGRALRMARMMKPTAAAPSVAPAAAPASANSGGRLVKAAAPKSLEDELAAALAETRKVQPPARISTPPQPTLPPSYTPRSTVPPTPVATAPAAPAAQIVGRAKPAPAAPAAEELPASWRALVSAPPPAETAQATVTVPGIITRRTPKPGAVAAARRALGSRDAGNIFGMSAQEVRAAAPGPSHYPYKRLLAEMDQDYARHLADPRGFSDLELLGALGFTVGGGAAAAPFFLGKD